MRTTATVARWLVRITGVIQIILGLLFWTGKSGFLVPIHMLSGSILVISLWILAVIAFQSGVNPRLAVLSIVWGLIVVLLGFSQDQLLPGPAHWLIQVLHLLLGLGAIGQAEGLASRILGSRSVAHQY